MNRYLEKVSSKVELEPGVSYDLAKHELKVSNKLVAEHIKTQDSNKRKALGAVYGLAGIPVGYAAGSVTADNIARRGSDKREAVFKKVIGPKGSPTRRLTVVNTPGENNIYSKIQNRISRKGFARVGGVLGASAAGLALGGLGYATGGIDSWDKPEIRNKYISKLEKKYQRNIDSLEGWD